MKKPTILEYFKEIKAISKEAMNLEAVVDAPSSSMYERGIYKTGDGDFVSPRRPGSEQHLQYKSRGLLSSNLW